MSKISMRGTGTLESGTKRRCAGPQSPRGASRPHSRIALHCDICLAARCHSRALHIPDETPRYVHPQHELPSGYCILARKIIGLTTKSSFPSCLHTHTIVPYEYDLLIVASCVGLGVPQEAFQVLRLIPVLYVMMLHISILGINVQLMAKYRDGAIAASLCGRLRGPSYSAADVELRSLLLRARR